MMIPVIHVSNDPSGNHVGNIYCYQRSKLATGRLVKMVGENQL